MFKNFRVRTVITAGLLSGLLLPAGLGVTYTLRHQRVELAENLANDVHRSAEILGLSLAEPLWNMDAESAKALISAVKKDPRSIAVTLETEEGVPGMEQLAHAPEPSVESKATVSASSDVKSRNGKVIGKVTTHFSSRAMERQLASQTRTFLLIALAQVLFSTGLIFLILSGRILKPVSDLARQAEMLSQGKLDTPFLWTRRDEMGDLGRALEFARGELSQLFAEVESKNTQLRHVNANLEELVAERSRSIKTIVDNVRAGFLLVDSESRLQDGFTKSCRDLLGTELRTGQKLCELLCLEGGRAECFEILVSQVFEDVLPESVSLAQIPGRFPVGEKVISLEGTAVRDEVSGKVRTILFTLTDVSDLERAQKENRTNRALIQILNQREAFQAFVADSRSALSDARDGLASANQKLVRMALHTLKGNSAAFGLEDLSHFIHQIEENETIGADDLEGVEWQFRSFLDGHRELLGISFDNSDEEVIPLGLSKLENVVRIVEEASDIVTLVPRFQDWVLEIRRKSARALLGPLPEYTEKLSERLGKPVRVEVIGGDVLLEPERMKPLLQSLVHLVRNSIDHGMEFPWERGKKSQTGSIRIEFADLSDSWRISVADDGRGIDAERVAAAAIERGLVSPEQVERMTTDQLCQLIFSENLSTAQETTEISGRGVGMGAVRQTVQELGGTICVETSAGFGTRIDIFVPKGACEPSPLSKQTRLAS